MTDAIAVANPFDDGEERKPDALARTDQQRAVAEVQAAMMIARANPRNQKEAVDRVLNACTRISLAEKATYDYSRGGTPITGPSIRLAEVIAQCWGNMQFGIRELSQGGGESTVQAFAWDVETNTRREVTFQVAHRRDTKKGSYKLTDGRDIYEAVANMGARRLRACLIALIPGDVIELAVHQCEVTMKARVDVSPEAIQRMLDAFAAIGVSKEQIEARLQRRIDAILPAQVLQMKKIMTSVTDGMSNTGDWFPALEEPEGKSVSDLKASLQKGKKAEPAPEPEPDPAPEEDPRHDPVLLKEIYKAAFSGPKDAVCPEGYTVLQAHWFEQGRARAAMPALPKVSG